MNLLFEFILISYNVRYIPGLWGSEIICYDGE